MKLTPLDIQHKEFRRSLKGYNEEEVDSFLDEVAEGFGQLFNENVELKERLEKLEEKMKQYEGLGQAIQRTLLTAEKSAEEIRANARKEAEIIAKEASLKVKEIIDSAYKECQQIHMVYANLKQKTQEFSANFKSMLQAFLSMIEKLETMIEGAPEIPLTEVAKEVLKGAPPMTEEMIEEMLEEEVPITEEVTPEMVEEELTKEEEIPEEPEEVSRGLVKESKIDEWVDKSKSIAGLLKTGRRKKKEIKIEEPPVDVQTKKVREENEEELISQLIGELSEETPTGESDLSSEEPEAKSKNESLREKFEGEDVEEIS
ncbi:MAG: DivIVA domain-containing protein [Candidatus Subteraquimicrobiales bacterium]|nr:DivIVA domain-containing protein [Candidatus Subteraquimicrobiales bacterium]